MSPDYITCSDPSGNPRGGQDEVERLAEEHNAKFAFLPCISSLRDERYPFPDGFTGLRGRVSEIVPQVSPTN